VDCEAQHGEFLEWSCANCPKVRTDNISERAMLIVYLHRLKKGGYPFGANDLEVEDWMDLGLAATIEEQAGPNAVISALFGI
jgi:hypothetical protein